MKWSDFKRELKAYWYLRKAHKLMRAAKKYAKSDPAVSRSLIQTATMIQKKAHEMSSVDFGRDKKG